MFTDDQQTAPLLGADIESGMITQIEEQDVIVTAETQSPETVSVWHILAASSALVFAKENQPRISAAALLSIMGIGLNFSSPYLLGEAIQMLTDGEDTVTLAGVELTRMKLIGLLIGSYASVQVASIVRDLIIAQVTGDNVKKLMNDSMAHLLKKSLNYHVNTDSGIQFCLIQKGFTMSTVGTQLLTQILPMALQILIAASLLSSQYDVELGASLVLLSIVYVAYSRATAKYVVDVNEEMLNSWNALYASMLGAIARYKIMRDFGKYEETMRELDTALIRCWSDAFVKTQTKPLQIGLGNIALSYAHMLWAAMYVSAGVESGKYSVQDFVVIMGYLLQLAMLMPAFGHAINSLFSAYPDLNFVFGELAKPDEVVDLHPGTPFHVVPGSAPSIEFDRVTFSYPPKPGEQNPLPVFENISFKVEPNQRVALVGKSKAGKSTIYNLLMGYEKPTHGTIKINGQDISKISHAALQKNVCLFGQTPNLFKGSVRENICYGTPKPGAVTDEMICKLARESNLDGFLNELKLDTDVGERGTGISGGEQQRVAILRGLIKNCPVWLLDEVTSSLDGGSADQVLQMIKKRSEDVTSLMITHKLTEAEDADRIVVIDAGKVLAQGTHVELMEACTLYRELHNKCTNKGEDERPHFQDSSIPFFSSSLKKSRSSENVSQLNLIDRIL